MKQKHIGSDFDAFLREDGILRAVDMGARKKGLAIDLRKIMKARGVSEAELARRMGTSRTAVRRILDPTEHGTRLDSLARLARALDCMLEVRILPKHRIARQPSGSRTSRASSQRAGTKRAA